MIQKNIRELVQYGLLTGLIEEADKIYTTNRLLELFGLDELEESQEKLEKIEKNMILWILWWNLRNGIENKKDKGRKDVKK